MVLNQDYIKKIGELYFIKGMTQDEIAKKLGTSQATISRLFKKGLKEGIIKKDYNEKAPYDKVDKVSLICEKYNLKDAVIVYHPNLESSTGISFFRRLGESAALYLEKILQPDMQVSVAHGRSVFYTIKALNERRMRINVDPLMLIRGMGVEEGKIPAWVNAIVFGTKFWMDQTWEQIIPQYMEDVKGEQLWENAKSMLEKSFVKHALKRIGESDIILEGVGPMYKDATFVRVAKNLGIEYFKLGEMGISGSICHTPVDREGNPITLLNLHKLAITISLDRLKELSLDQQRYIILIAAGIEKFEIIETALKGRYCNVLVTDEIVADYLIHKEKK